MIDRDPTDLGLTDPDNLVLHRRRPPRPPAPRPPLDDDPDPPRVPSQRHRDHLRAIAEQMGWGESPPRRCDFCRGFHERGAPHTRPWRC